MIVELSSEDVLDQVLSKPKIKSKEAHEEFQRLWHRIDTKQPSIDHWKAGLDLRKFELLDSCNPLSPSPILLTGPSSKLVLSLSLACHIPSRLLLPILRRL